MKYKLVAIDLDGTLLNSHGDIWPEVVKQIKTLSNNINFILTTGRHHSTVVFYHQQLGLQTPIICCNGSYLYDVTGDRYSYESAIEKTDVDYFLSRSENLDLIAYADDKIILEHRHPANYINKLEKWGEHLPEGFQPKIIRVDSVKEEIVKAKQVWTFVTEGTEQEISSIQNDSRIVNQFSFEQSWYNRIGFNRKGNSKGVLLSKLMTAMDISPFETAAVGDNDNDVSMFDVVGLPIAMNNATDKLKQQARYITTSSNDDNGMLEALKLISKQ
ncbi:HAD family hydrolase [Vibrio maritimus]|uniref:HAD family hydrolase n=1 Tax=Vibrio maritimus TaxID=990268 RepID=UPI00373625D8